MALISIIFSVLVTLEPSSQSNKFSAPTPGFVVSAVIDAARVLGLPFISQRRLSTVEANHEFHLVDNRGSWAA